MNSVCIGVGFVVFVGALIWVAAFAWWRIVNGQVNPDSYGCGDTVGRRRP